MSTPWNEEDQTAERQEMREWIAQTFLDTIGSGEKRIFSLTSSQCNCVKTFEKDKYFPDASFVSAEHLLQVFKNIEHPKVEKYYGKVGAFIREQTVDMSLDAAWLDYTVSARGKMEEVADFIDAFFVEDRDQALALTFIKGATGKSIVDALDKLVKRPTSIDLIDEKTEKKKGKNKYTMHFVILKIHPAG